MALKVRHLRRFHAGATVIWLGLVIPTLLWWRDSILWIALMSIWANIEASFAAWQGARAEDAAE